MEGEEERRALLERIAQLEADKVVAEREHDAHIEQSSEPQDIGLKELKLTLDELQETHEATVKERDSLIAEISLLKIARDDAEKNALLFRDLYSRASSFTDELQAENTDLRSRLRVAESQVTNGIQLVRAQYTARVEKLTSEVEKSQILLAVLQEKDRRTDDEVRRRAAREPELLAKIDESRQALQERKADLATVLRQRNDLLVEKQQLTGQIDEGIAERSTMHRELRRLKVELARFSARERSIKKMIDPLHSQDEDIEDEYEDPDEVDVFVCSWALDGGAERCGEIYLSRQVGLCLLLDLSVSTEAHLLVHTGPARPPFPRRTSVNSFFVCPYTLPPSVPLPPLSHRQIFIPTITHILALGTSAISPVSSTPFTS